MIKVTGSPKIHESLCLGFTKEVNINVIESQMSLLYQEGFKIISIDMCFGFVTVALTNPSVDFNSYTKERADFVSRIENIVNTIEGNKCD